MKILDVLLSQGRILEVRNLKNVFLNITVNTFFCYSCNTDIVTVLPLHLFKLFLANLVI